MTEVNVTIELRLPIPAEHRCYADHFPGAPLVPGALLLKWIMELVINHLTTDPRLANQIPSHVHYLKQIKFVAPVLPGDELRVSVTPGTKEQQLTVAAYKGDTLVLKGQMEFTVEPAHD